MLLVYGHYTYSDSISDLKASRGKGLHRLFSSMVDDFLLKYIMQSSFLLCGICLIMCLCICLHYHQFLCCVW